MIDSIITRIDPNLIAASPNLSPLEKAAKSLKADYSMAYDANGNLVSDGQHGITSVIYNHLDQPTGITLASGEGVTYMYGHGGNRLLALLRSPSGATVTKRAYLGPAIFENDTLKMWLFPGGYFDAKFEPHYYVTDYQGNITHDVTSSGYICQKTNYYPYGEPWQEPKGDNRYLFGGKERENLADLRLYDFGPRMLNSAEGRWYAPDKMNEKYYSISPYAYCVGNPVKFRDPSGKMVVLVHGTFAKPDTWEKEKELAEKFNERFGSSKNTLNFKWSGENNGAARTIAANILVSK